MGLHSDEMDAEWSGLGARLDALRPALLRLRWVRDQTADDAEDCIQEAIYRLLRSHGPALSEWVEARLFAYLRKVTLHCLPQPRSCAVVQTSSLTSEIVDPASGPEQQFVRRLDVAQRRRLAYCALYRLPKDRRRLVRDWEDGTDWAKIARTHRISEWAARKRLERCWLAMRQFTATHEEVAPSLYHLTPSRLREIANSHSALTVEIVREFCLADWSEGDQHQDWLECAPAEEIGDWILALMESGRGVV